MGKVRLLFFVWHVCSKAEKVKLPVTETSREGKKVREKRSGNSMLLFVSELIGGWHPPGCHAPVDLAKHNLLL